MEKASTAAAEAILGPGYNGELCFSKANNLPASTSIKFSYQIISLVVKKRMKARFFCAAGL